MGFLRHTRGSKKRCECYAALQKLENETTGSTECNGPIQYASSSRGKLLASFVLIKL